MKPAHPVSFDLIGDIHGHYDKLVHLLLHLGYHPHGLSFHHPEGRRIIFLGDYIDRGPKVRQVLHLVRAMVESGDAFAIMGNHEYNAILYHEPDGRGDWLRPRRLDRDSGLRVSLAQFAEHMDEWAEWLEWMKRLPLFLDFGGLRAVHACWDLQRIPRLMGQSLADPAFLHASARRFSPEHRAVENILKGPEMRLPEGCLFQDKVGIQRDSVRVRWWDLPAQARISQLALPEPFDAPGDAQPHEIRRVPCYGPDEPPVFCGHYWLPPHHPRAPLAPNIACLDFSAARGDHPLVAYRWQGEALLNPAHFSPAAPAILQH
jgi:hypothetical protein